MVDNPVHVAAGSCYHLMQQHLLEHPSSCSQPNHLAGEGYELCYLCSLL